MANGFVPVARPIIPAMSPVPPDIGPGTVKATGSTTARTLAARFADVVNVKDYGAVGDGVTDDTAAIQNAINTAAARSGVVYVAPVALGSYYKFTRLYLHYDAALNPGFPQGNPQSHAVVLRGAGQISDTSTDDPTNYNGSLLVSTDATGPAVYADGGGAYSVRGLVLDGVNIVATNSTAVIKLVSANTGSIIQNAAIRQNGTGGGVDWDSPWVLSGMRNVHILSGSSTVTAGSFGWRMRAATSGGQVFIDNVIVSRAYGAAGGFDIGGQLGAKAGETVYENSLIDAVHIGNSAFQQVNTGLIVGARARGVAIIAPYFESCASRAVHITNKAGNVAVEGGFFYNPAAVDGEVVVDAAAAGAPIHGIRIVNNFFNAVLNYGVDLLDATYTTGLIAGNRFYRYGAGAAVGIKTNGHLAPWAVEDNVFDGGMTSYEAGSVFARRFETDGTMQPMADANGYVFWVADSGSGTNYKYAGMRFLHGGVRRWTMAKTPDAGGDFKLMRYDDAGSYVDDALTIARATGLMSIKGSVVVVGGARVTALPTYADNTAALAAGLAAGQLYRTATGSVMVAY